MATIAPLLSALEKTRRVQRAALQLTDGIDRFLDMRRREQMALAQLLNGGNPESQRAAAAELTAIAWNRALLSPKPSDRGVWRQARLLAKEYGFDVRRFISQNLTSCFLDAANKAGQRQAVRIGRAWITDQNGRKRLVRPRTLPRYQLVKWLRATAFKELRQLIGFDEPTIVSYRETDTVVGLSDTGATLLAVNRRATEGALALLDPNKLARLSRRERQILELVICDGLSAENIAKKLRRKPSTIRQFKFRAIRKLRDL